MRIRSILLTSYFVWIPAMAFATGTASVTASSKAPPIAFAAEEIRSALKQAHWALGEGESQAKIAIKLQEPDGRGDDESFEITTDNADDIVHVTVRGKDVRGVMYGGLDVAEQIATSQGPVKIAPRQGKPFLPVRGLKFNIPLAGNDYLSKEDREKGDWFWDLEYWRTFMRFLAYNRYNLLSFWNSHPYDQMVRLEKYPEANSLSKEEMDRNIAFFHKLFGMARDCGLDTSIVTWNIHMSPAFQKAHKIKDGEDTPLVRDYQRECVRELLKEYPELTGMGTCPGERMRGVTTESPEEWIRLTYLQGIADAGRTNAPFILRYWGGTPPTTAKMLEKAKYPGPMYLDIKFNGEQMYSSTKMHLKDKSWLTQNPKGYKLLWHLRNDCIYQLRWCDPEFAAAVIRNCGGPDSAGFVMGSEIEVPGIDRNHTANTAGHKAWNYEFEKNWTRFGLWGRAGYNPDESSDYWIARFSERFGTQAGPSAFEALAAASKIIPLTTSFHWNYMNGDWYPEGNVGVWNTSAEMPFANYRDNKLWHDVLEWTFTHVIDDSLQCIPDYVADQLTGAKAGEQVITPPHYAQMLEGYADACAKARSGAGNAVANDNDEWKCTEMDLRALELLGRYYAAKARAATEVMFFLATGDEQHREVAIDHLNKALEFWTQLAQVADSHYAAHEIWLFGKQFDWGRYIPEAERDINLVRELAPWPHSDQEWKVGGKTVLLSTWQIEPQLSSRLKPWLELFNNQAMANVAGADTFQASQGPANTNLVFTDAGTGIITMKSNAIESARINGQPAQVVGAAPSQSIVGPVQVGTNRLELVFADTIALPSVTNKMVIPRNAQFLEAESGKVTAPFETSPLKGTSGDTIVRIPKGKGRGESNNGKIVDNGWITYEVDLPADGNYVVHMAAFWPDTSANSFHYAWDSAAPRVLGNDDTFLSWHWVATAPEKLKAGKHKLTIRNRDEGSAFDCLLVAPAATDSAAAMLDNYYERLASPHHLKYKSLEEWTARRQEVRKAVLRALGLDPMPEKLPLDVSYGGQLDRGDYIVKRVYWQTWPGVYASGYLYLPKTKGTHPAMLSPTGHHVNGTRHPQEQTRSIALAKKGYVSLAIDSVHMPKESFLIGASSIGVMTYNAMRGVDLLETLPEVDATRIGCNGMSGGGQQTAYMMAVDDRVAVGVPVVLVSWFRKIMSPAGFPHCICNVVPGLLRDVDMPEMVATFAPKPAFYECVTGDWEANFPTDEYPEIQAIYDLYKAKSDVGVQRWDTFHDYNQPMREQAYEFFNKHLKQLEDPSRAAEPAVQTESLETLATLDKPPTNDEPNQAIIDWYRSQFSFRSPEPNDAAAWSAWQKDLRARVTALVGDVAVKGELAGPEEEFDFLGARGRRLLVRSETGIEIPVLFATPTEDTASPLVVMICDKGIRGAIEEQTPLLSALLAKKSAVAIAEVRLTGRMKRDWELDSVLFGRPEVGMAVTDLRCCLDVLAEQRGVDPKHVKLIGLGNCGVTALFAGAMEPRLTAVAAPDLGATYLKGRSNPLIANILRVTDLPQLIAATAPRDMLVGGVDTGDFDCAMTAYGTMNSKANLELRQGAVNMKDVADWIAR